MRRKKLERKGRRNFIKGLAEIGVSATALKYITKPALADLTDKPEKEVPRLKSLEHVNHEAVVEEGARPEREPVFYTVPRDGWAITESAHDVRDRIDDRIQKRFNTKLKVTVSTQTNGDKQITVHVPTPSTGEKLGIDVPDKETIRKILPKEIDGVAGRGGSNPITVEDIPVFVEEMEVTLRNNYDESYRPVPAGVRWRVEEQKNGKYLHDDYCTTGTPAYDEQANEERIVTAEHCFVEFGGNTFRQPAAEESGMRARGIGNYPGGVDAAVVEPYTFDTKYDLGDEGGGYRGLPVTGVKGKDWIKDQEGTNTKLTFQGANTGTQSGKIVDTGDKVFGTDNSLGGGDSGGPAHRPQTGSSWKYTNIAGILSYVENGTEYFVYMVDIENDLNVTV